MTVIEIQGTRVDVGEDFLSLTPDQQGVVADEIFNSPDFQRRLGAQPPAETEDQGEPQEPGFFQRIATRLEGRGDDFNTIVDAFQETQQEITEEHQADPNIALAAAKFGGALVADGFSVIGKVAAGGLLDIVGEGVSTLAGGAFDVLKGLDELTSTDEERARRDEQLKVLFDEVAGSDLVQKATSAAGEGFEAYNAFAEKNPRAARMLEAAANIALVFAPVKGKPKAGRGVAEKIEDPLTQSTRKAIEETGGVIASEGKTAFLVLRGEEPFRGKTLLDYEILAKDGTPLALLEATVSGNSLRIESINNPLAGFGSQASQANTLGPSVIREGVELLSAAHPNVTRFTGKRVSGARAPELREKRGFEVGRDEGVEISVPVRKRPPPPEDVVAPTIVGRMATALQRSAETQTAGERASFVADLVRPRTSKKVREAEILRTTEGAGLTGQRTVAPSPTEVSMAEAVTSVPGVTAKNTQLQNLDAIQSAATQEARTLESLLGRSPARIPQETVKRALDGAAERLAANPILVGDAAKTGDRTIAKAVELLGESPNTPLGVLKARRQFDAWVKQQRPKVFDPATESALSIAVRETRQTMNDIISTSAPGVRVKDSLGKQTNLLNALDNLSPKAADEAGTAIKRLAQRVNDSVGLPRVWGTATRMGLIIGAGGSAFVAGLKLTVGAAAVAGLVAGTKKVATAAGSKRLLSALLRASEKAIQQAKRQNNTQLLRQLRADRAAVVEIVKAGQGND